jgi:hypothetical protein
MGTSRGLSVLLTLTRGLSVLLTLTRGLSVLLTLTVNNFREGHSTLQCWVNYVLVCRRCRFRCCCFCYFARARSTRCRSWQFEGTLMSDFSCLFVMRGRALRRDRICNCSYVRSEFTGQLPKPFGLGGTTEVPAHMNLLNVEEPTRSVEAVSLSNQFSRKSLRNFRFPCDSSRLVPSRSCR